MSFITKRDRVFNDYETFDLPSRNEGKLKTYASCTDARAWSHFISDQSEHLADIIKRNNEKCRPKYIPTDVIVNTLMSCKNAEISRLKRKIEELEQLLAVFDQLELNDAQKEEIADAHAAIRAANKDLNDLCLDLNLSGFTDVVDSEAFETGQSRGEEPGYAKFRSDETPKSRDTEEWFYQKGPPVPLEVKSNQTSMVSPRDASTSAHDSRIDEMKEVIICKDAKLCAMKNTMAVLENDVCEPYCIYAHIYTALEKIFGILYQNEKYKNYLDLLTGDKDTRSIDVKGKILFKMKVLEKFCLALIAPCSQEASPYSPKTGCSCTPKTAAMATTTTTTTTAMALTNTEFIPPNNKDNKRAHLVAEIMGHAETNDLLCKAISAHDVGKNKVETEILDESYDVDNENLKRLKNLQEDYDDLMTCYEDLKHEKGFLQERCRKYDELEIELENMRSQLREYSALWNEKEHYRKRSQDLDDLKEKFLVLSDETSDLETQLKAETEITDIKTNTIDELRGEIVLLEKKLHEMSIAFEKEKNALQCKLKETECQVMCQEQQIRSLSAQIDRFLEHDIQNNLENENLTPKSAETDEEDLKVQNSNLKDALLVFEEEKQRLLDDFEDKLKLINLMRMEIEDWKGKYEKALQEIKYLEKLSESVYEEVERLKEENKILSNTVSEKNEAVENLVVMMNNKAENVNVLLNENKELLKQLNDFRQNHVTSLLTLKTEKEQALSSLELARKESTELLNKVKSHDELLHKQRDLQAQIDDQKQLLEEKTLENTKLLLELQSAINNNEFLKNEIQRLTNVNNNAVESIHALVGENLQYKQSLELAKKESKEVIGQLGDFEDLSRRFNQISESHEKLKQEKEKLENELHALVCENSQYKQSLELAKKESKEVIGKLGDFEDLSRRFKQISESHEELKQEKEKLENELRDKTEKLADALSTIKLAKKESDGLMSKLEESENLSRRFNQISESHEKLKQEKEKLENELRDKTEKLADAMSTIKLTKKESDGLMSKLEESENLSRRFNQISESHEKLKQEKEKLENELRNKTEKLTDAMSTIKLTKKESDELMNKLERSENLKDDLVKLNEAYQRLVNDKSFIKNELAQKNRELENLSEFLEALKKENESLLCKSEQVPSLEQELLKLKAAYDNLIYERNILQTDFDNKTEEMKRLYNNLESKIDENRELNNQIKTLQNNEMTTQNTLGALKLENFNTKSALVVLKQESQSLLDKLKQYESLQVEHEKLKDSHEKINDKYRELQLELEKNMNALKCLDEENSELNKQIQSLTECNLNLEDTLNQLRDKLTKAANVEPYDMMKRRISEMEEEKTKNKLRIRELSDQLDDMKNKIDDLVETLTAREERIVIHENYINKLEDEIRKLNENIDDVISAGEQIKDNAYKKIDQSVYQIEAHHSRAAHNMKIELAQLQSQNYKLEDKLSTNKLIVDEASSDKNKYLSLIKNLQYDREILVTGIKELELSSIGDSNLSPEHCSTEDILSSLNRITKYLDAKSSKSNALEQTIIKVQTSSQLLSSKADEAKKILEKEKNKIINEKEEAIRDKIELEKHCRNLKEKLENQIAKDKEIIQNLEAEISNQELIINKIKDSTQSDILRLEEEVNKINDSYKGALDKIKELEEKLSQSNQKYDKQLKLVKKFDETLKNKRQQIQELQKDITGLKAKPDHSDFATQTPKTENKTMFSQTVEDEITADEKFDSELSADKLINALMTNQTPPNNKYSDSSPKPIPTGVNEVQILTVNVEPTLDFVRSSYLNYKLKRLTPGKMEQYSIASQFQENDEISKSQSKRLVVKPKISNNNVVDIYNRQSVLTNSSKGDVDLETTGSHKDRQSPKTTGIAIDNQLAADSFETEKKDSKNVFRILESSTEKSTDEDVFIIYGESEKSSENKHDRDRKPKNKSTQNKVSALRPNDFEKSENNKQRDREEVEFEYFDANFSYDDENDDSTKPKLTIRLPSDNTDSLPLKTSDDKNPLDSDTLETYLKTQKAHSDTSLSTEHKIVIDQYRPLVQKPQTRNQSKVLADSVENKPKRKPAPQQKAVVNLKGEIRKSQHKLSRIGAGVLVEKSGTFEGTDSLIKSSEFGLQYILDSVQRERNPRSSKPDSPNSALSLRTSKSDDTSKQNNAYNTYHQKTLYAQGALSKVDDTEEYERKIEMLTKTLKYVEHDYKRKLEAIKRQYDNHIKSIMNDHNHGVASIQNLHEETLQDIIKVHENEVENLRTMSIDAMRKVELLEKENQALKAKISRCVCDKEPTRIATPDVKRRKCKNRGHSKVLSKTNVEAFNVKPKRVIGLCTCSIDIPVSDTIKNIFQQVDTEQRKRAELAYTKFIANKIMECGNVENLEMPELSFLHLKVCRTWKLKLSQEEALQKKIDSMEHELMKKQRDAKQHIAALDRQVAEERRRLQEVREAVCSPQLQWHSQPFNLNMPWNSQEPVLLDRNLPYCIGENGHTVRTVQPCAHELISPPPPRPQADTDFSCYCNTSGFTRLPLVERQSAGDLTTGLKIKRGRVDHNKNTLVKLEPDQRRDRRFHDEPPTRLRKNQGGKAHR